MTWIECTINDAAELRLPEFEALPDPDCPRCDGEGAYRDGDGAREWIEDCPCVYGATCEREEMPL